MVREALDQIEALKDDKDALRTIIPALTTHAVIIYCRATHSKADARDHIGVTKGFTPEQRNIHNAVTKLRDTTLAHFGFPEGRFAIVRQRQAAIVVEEHDGFSVGFNVATTTLNCDLVASLRDLTDAALKIATAKRNNFRDVLADSWNRYTFTPEVRTMLRQYVDTYEEFWGTDWDGVERTMASPRHKDLT